MPRPSNRLHTGGQDDRAQPAREPLCEADVGGSPGIGIDDNTVSTQVAAGFTGEAPPVEPVTDVAVPSVVAPETVTRGDVVQVDVRVRWHLHR